MVKVMACLKRRSGMSSEEFRRYWRDVHGPLVRSVPEFTRHVRRYVQSHAVSDHVPGVPTAPSPFDGVAELWFDSLEDAARAYAEPRFHEILLPDGLKFFDPEGCVFLVAEEIEM